MGALMPGNATVLNNLTRHPANEALDFRQTPGKRAPLDSGIYDRDQSGDLPGRTYEVSTPVSRAAVTAHILASQILP